MTKDKKEFMDSLECIDTQRHLEKCEKCRKWAEETANEHKIDDYLYEKHKREKRPEREFNDQHEDKI